jgi:hypothetical protein
MKTETDLNRGGAEARRQCSSSWLCRIAGHKWEEHISQVRWSDELHALTVHSWTKQYTHCRRCGATNPNAAEHGLNENGN